MEDSKNFSPSQPGIYNAEALSTALECTPSIRTPVKFESFENTQVTDEALLICEQGELTLDAGSDVLNYLWSTGETTRKISVTSPGNFSVILTNVSGCSVEKIIEVNEADQVGFKAITSEKEKIIIHSLFDGNFEYSLDGYNFQESNEFNVPGGLYTVFMRDNAGCEMISQEYPHLVYPQFITPNADGYNDFFEIKGLEFYSQSYIKIFDRYRKLLKAEKGENFSWNGVLNARNLPAADYWFEISIENYKPQKSHFSLIR